MSRHQMLNVAKHFADSYDPVYTAHPAARLELFMVLVGSYILAELEPTELMVD